MYWVADNSKYLKDFEINFTIPYHPKDFFLQFYAYVIKQKWPGINESTYSFQLALASFSSSPQIWNSSDKQ